MKTDVTAKTKFAVSDFSLISQTKKAGKLQLGSKEVPRNSLSRAHENRQNQ